VAEAELVTSKYIEGLNIEKNAQGQPVGCRVSDWSPSTRPRREPLEGRFCRLEPLDPARHAASLHESNQLDVEGVGWTYMPYGPFPDFQAYHDWVAKSAVSEDPLFFAIIDRVSGTAVGVASYLRIDPASGVIEIGHLQFSPRLQHTSAATEALYLLMRRAFMLGYRRLEWKCNALNAPSRRAAQRLGLSFEGIFRQATVVKGRNRDTAWYAAIDSEWPELCSAFEQWLDPANFGSDGTQKTALSTLTAPILKNHG
jgi:RimJ/RimL family protein N-acetyltransferase